MKQQVNSETFMQDFGKIFAQKLKGGEVIELVGDVGAGKTTFVKGLAKGLGIAETVQSPSFTLFARYDTPDGRSLHHYDFYRLDEPGVVAYDLTESLGDNKAITVVEWADTVSHVLPDEHITIRIAPLSETERQLEITGVTS